MLDSLRGRAGGCHLESRILKKGLLLFRLLCGYQTLATMGAELPFVRADALHALWTVDGQEPRTLTPIAFVSFWYAEKDTWDVYCRHLVSCAAAALTRRYPKFSDSRLY